MIIIITNTRKQDDESITVTQLNSPLHFSTLLPNLSFFPHCTHATNTNIDISKQTAACNMDRGLKNVDM